MNQIFTLTKIANFITKYGIQNTNIRKDANYTYVIDINGDVNLSNKNLTDPDMTAKFGKVTGNFECQNNNLTSLDFAPDFVGGDFDCSNNNLISLENAPEFVGGDFDCSNNQLTSLAGCPKEVKGYLNCINNRNLKSLEGIKKVKGQIYSDFFEGKIENYGKKKLASQE